MNARTRARVGSLLAAAGSLALMAGACSPSTDADEVEAEAVEAVTQPPSDTATQPSSEAEESPEAATGPEDETAAGAEEAAETAETADAVPAGGIDPHSDTPIGYASMNGGTDGGYGGDTVRELVLSEYSEWSAEDTAGEALYQELREHSDDEGAGLVVHVDVTVTRDQVAAGDIDIKDVSNVSILGVGESGEFDGIGFGITRSHNVVLRNLSIHHVSEGQGDAVGVSDSSSNIWIDHNEFFSELDGVHKDHYDGLVDIKRNAEYVTVSWNEFHSHWKASLIGHEDQAGSAPDHITFHHNRFRDINSRTPLIRAADVHMLNNVFEDVRGSAINARIGAQVLVEGNYFDGVGSGGTDRETGHISGPVGWWYGGDQTGYWNLVDNAYTDTPHEHLESTTDFTVPYAYEAHSPEDAREAVEAYAGTGVVTP